MSDAQDRAPTATHPGSPAEETSRAALAALVLGVLGVLIPPLPGIAALVLGRVATERVDASRGRLRGAGMARAGFVLGLVSIGEALVLLFVAANRMTYLRAMEMKNASQLRGFHQSTVIYASSNMTYMPGLNSKGVPHADGPTTGFSGPGESVSGRFYIMLNGNMVPGDLLVNPRDAITKYTTGRVTAANYSYAMLCITDAVADAGRRAEWRDLANAQAVMLSDRNTGASAADAAVRSAWNQTPGRWRGNTVWGDNHVEFTFSTHGFVTRYAKQNQRDDNLFATGGGRTTTDDSAAGDANAFLIWGW